MKRRYSVLAALSVGALALAASGCSTDSAPRSGTPTIAVTTNILADVVSTIVGDHADVLVLMPPGADPHSFQLSTQDVARLYDADLLVANGLGLEEMIETHIDAASAEGVAVLSVGDAVDPLLSAELYGEHADHDHDHAADTHGADEHVDDGHAHTEGETDHTHDDHAHDNAEHGDDAASDAGHEGHDHGPYDPHFWHDPSRMKLAVDAIEAELVTIDGIDADGIRAGADAYRALLDALDAELEAQFRMIPDGRRLLVSQHQVFGYLAHRYHFELIGSIVPSGTTIAEASAADLATIAQEIAATGAPAIFSDASQSEKLADAVAADAGVRVVPLYTESLAAPGQGAETYLDMMRTNGERITEALTE